MAITQIIATLPAVLNDSETFYEDIAIRNNSLVAVSFPTINTWATQANALQEEINATAAQVAAASDGSSYSQEYIDEKKIENIASIKNFGTLHLRVNTVFVKDYHTDIEGGDGIFVYDATRLKSEHNGGTVIDPTAVFPTDWNNQTQLTTWFDSANAGSGVWVRKYDGAVNVKWFGAVGDAVLNTATNQWEGTNDSLAVQTAIKYLYTKVKYYQSRDWFKGEQPSKLVFPDGQFLLEDTIYTRGQINISSIGSATICSNNTEAVFESAYTSAWTSSWGIVELTEDNVNGMSIVDFGHSNLQFEGLTFHNCHICIRTNGSLWGSYVNNCKFLHCGQALVTANSFYSSYRDTNCLFTKKTALTDTTSLYDTKGKFEFGFATNGVTMQNCEFGYFSSDEGTNQGIGIEFKENCGNVNIVSCNFELGGIGILLSKGCNSLHIQNAYAEELYYVIHDNNNEIDKYNLKLLNTTCNGGSLCNLSGLRMSEIDETSMGGSITLYKGTAGNSVTINEWSRMTNPTKFIIDSNDTGVKLVPTSSTYGVGANGDIWLKHHNGVMECFGTFAQAITTTGAGSLFRQSYAPVREFPVTFITPPIVTVTISWDPTPNSGRDMWIGALNSSTTVLSGNIWSAVAMTDASTTFMYRAIGRWY